MAKANLVIVESPAKAKTIGKYLGPTYQVLASMGHVRDLPKSKMGVDLETGEFEPQYQPIKGKEETIAHNLYAVLREFDDIGVDRIFCEAFPETELGQAIMNRLIKAAGHKIVKV